MRKTTVIVASLAAALLAPAAGEAKAPKLLYKPGTFTGKTTQGLKATIKASKKRNWSYSITARLYCYRPAPLGSPTSIVDDGNFTKTYKQIGGGFGSFREKPPGRKKKVLVSFFRFNNQTSSPQGFWGTDNTRLWNKQAWGDFVVSQEYPDGRKCQTNSRDLTTGQANSKPPSIRLKLKTKKKKK